MLDGSVGRSVGALFHSLTHSLTHCACRLVTYITFARRQSWCHHSWCHIYCFQFRRHSNTAAAVIYAVSATNKINRTNKWWMNERTTKNRIECRSEQRVRAGERGRMLRRVHRIAMHCNMQITQRTKLSHEQNVEIITVCLFVCVFVYVSVCLSCQSFALSRAFLLSDYTLVHVYID